jgi:DNA-binding PadR family transcriptional regulator
MEESRLLEDLTLLLLCAQSWREKIGESLYVTRSWKGYDFDILDRLAERGYIIGSRRAKSVTLTDQGVKRGEALRRRLLTKVKVSWKQ